MRRVIVMAVGVVLTGLAMSMAQAEDRRERGDKVLSGVLSGLMGESPQPADAAYAAQEHERLVSLQFRFAKFISMKHPQEGTDTIQGAFDIEDVKGGWPKVFRVELVQ